MARVSAAWIAGLCLLASSGCSSSLSSDVIAADGALCDISQRLAGRDLQVGCLLGPQDDPHQLQLTPAQRQQLSAAQLVLINGYGLTPALERGSPVVRVAELAVPDSPRLEAHEHHHHDGEAGNTSRDPHVWHDPRQAAALVKVVAAQLQQLKPEAANRIQRRSERLQASLEALHRWNQRQFASVAPPRTLASSHRGFASLARAYGLKELALIAADSNSEVMRPHDLTQTLKALKANKVQRLFSELSPPGKTIQRLSALSGIAVAPEPLQADTAGSNLMATLSQNTCVIARNLGGSCDTAGREQLLQAWDQAAD